MVDLPRRSLLAALAAAPFAAALSGAPVLAQEAPEVVEMTPGAWSKSLSILQKQPPAKMATAVSAACALVIIMAPAMATPIASLFFFIWIVSPNGCP